MCLSRRQNWHNKYAVKTLILACTRQIIVCIVYHVKTCTVSLGINNIKYDFRCFDKILPNNNSNFRRIKFKLWKQCYFTKMLHIHLPFSYSSYDFSYIIVVWKELIEQIWHFQQLLVLFLSRYDGSFKIFFKKSGFL